MTVMDHLDIPIGRAIAIAMRRRIGPLGAVLVALMAPLLCPRTGRADGAFPDSMQLFLPPDRPQELILGTNFGLLVSRDGGRRWSFICEEAIADPGEMIAQYQLGPAPADVLFARSSDRVLSSTDRGCSWTAAQGAWSDVTDLFVDTTAPGHLFALALVPGGGGLASTLLESRDTARSFVPLFQAGEGALLTGVENAAGAPGTIYLSESVRVPGGGVQPRLARSVDGGKTFRESDLLGSLGAREPRIAAVDPAEPRTIYYRIVDQAGDELAISRDGGETAQVVLLREGRSRLSGPPRQADGAGRRRRLVRRAGSGGPVRCRARRRDGQREGQRLRLRHGPAGRPRRVVADRGVRGRAGRRATARPKQRRGRPQEDRPMRTMVARSLRAGVLAVAVIGGLAGGSAVRHAGAAPTPADFQIEEATIAELQAAMQAGRLTARRLVELYLARIAAFDQRGPSLRQVLETNPEATAIADALDAERRARGPRGPLHGIPVLLKDNIDTADRLTTTAGSLALEGSRPPRDAFVVERLRAAGAIILGKTNMSEWANFRSTQSTSGWSGRGGQGRNPYVLDRSPCGSSSGTGAAIAASFAAVGVGTETDGSIVCPAALNALVGLKPTIGLVSRAGIIPIAHSQDTAGPMARTVADAAVLLGVLAGPDPRDPVTRRAPASADYSKLLGVQSLKGARIGVARKKFFGYNEATDRLAEQAIAVLKAQGAVVVDPADIPNVGTYENDELEVLLHEFKTDLGVYLGTLGPAAPVKSLQELIAFNESHRDREMPFFGQDLFEKAQKKGLLTSPAYRRALTRSQRLARQQGLDAVMTRHHLDALVAPTTGPAWVIDRVTGDHFAGGSSTPAAVAGYPSITVPIGFVHDLPVGLSFIGRAWSEPRLLALAYAFEQATHHRRPPRFLPTVDLSAP
jgi:amidase